MDTGIAARVRDLVRERGVAAAARELRLPRTTVISIAAEAAREGTMLLAAQRWAEREREARALREKQKADPKGDWTWTNRRVATACGVHHQIVARLLDESSTSDRPKVDKRVSRDARNAKIPTCLIWIAAMACQRALSILEMPRSARVTAECGSTVLPHCLPRRPTPCSPPPFALGSSRMIFPNQRSAA
jgi:hypothetical protein